jgi:UDP-arabinose 4-epimerase
VKTKNSPTNPSHSANNSPVLVIGGAGYIGSHCCKTLSRAGFRPIVFDNLSTGHTKAVKWGPLIEGDILNQGDVEHAIAITKPRAIIHLAASAYVGESIANPAKYYRNNVVGMLHLLDSCRMFGVDKIVFSSSCATYGAPKDSLISEASPQFPINPYGRTKLICEHMLQDYAEAYGLRYVALRYFNAAGADPEQELGEWHDPETHLLPRAMMAAFGSGPSLQVFGTDYPTPDGTCIRDYIHVTDLAQAHISALNYLLDHGVSACINVGTGRGHSIRDVMSTIQRITNRHVPHEFAERREGDPAVLVADARLARKLLGFTPLHSSLENIIRTAVPFFEKA